MKPRPTISVVVPTYNRAALICETLDRILRQTVPADEVIVVDDGSTDDTQAVLAQYGDQIKSIIIPNSGDLVARNVGMRAASGQLVAFCDSDDLWELNFLEEMIWFWTSGPQPICSYCNFRLVHEEIWGQKLKFDQAPSGYWSDLTEPIDGHSYFRKPLVRKLIEFQPFFVSCLVADREQFLAIGGWDEGVSRKVGCDFATTLRLAEHAPFGVLQKPLVGIRRHAGNISGNVQKMNLGDAEVLEYVLATRPGLKPYAAEIHQSVAQRRLDAFDTAFARRDFQSVKSTAKLLPQLKGARHALKLVISSLPAPLRDIAWNLLTGRRA
ncbi:MAG: glycosyltransferase family 2 protein [Janthinobacterium lividum]